jgi:hypothetical protein
VFLVNSRYPLVCATLDSSESKSRHQQGSSFSRSYGCNLPSSLTIVLPIALVFSTRPPVSVWGTGTVSTHCWDFLGSMESVTSTLSRHHVSALRLQLSSESAYTLTRGLPSPRFTYPPASPVSYPPAARSVRSPEGEQPRRCHSWTWREHGGTGILTSCASTTPFGLALAPDLPWGD